MDDNIVLQSLTESFEIIKDSWETKKEAITGILMIQGMNDSLSLQGSY